MPRRQALLYLAALAMLWCAVPASAGDLFLDINGISKHNKSTYLYRGATHDYNSRNTGLGLTAGLNKYFEASGGFYDNSYDRQSLYASATLKHDLPYREFRFTPGISVGVVTGYKNTPVRAATLQPSLIASVRATWRGVGFTVGYIPRVNRGEGIPVSVITLQANVQLNREAKR